MASKDRGVSALDRLRSRYDREDMQCPECGYEDDGGKWLSATNGQRVDYRHVCPGCGAVRRRTFTLD
jgi:predicted RNA-binding Zn-ribbon protein involved in translation (DUF1610 family)